MDFKLEGYRVVAYGAVSQLGGICLADNYRTGRYQPLDDDVIFLGQKVLIGFRSEGRSYPPWCRRGP